MMNGPAATAIAVASERFSLIPKRPSSVCGHDRHEYTNNECRRVAMGSTRAATVVALKSTNGVALTVGKILKRVGLALR
jgi:hypothetical protein